MSVPLSVPLDRVAPEAALDAAVSSEQPEGADTLPGAGAFARAVLGFGALGAVAATGGPAFAEQAPAGLLSATGALLLTVPALLVAHPFLALRASPQALFAAIARPFANAGALALGLVPAMLLFRATSGLARPLLLLLLLGVGAQGLSFATRNLRHAEQAVSKDGWSNAKMLSLSWAWALLAALIAARLGLA